MKGKIVVIGSGLGGLSSGVFLAKGGYDVTILEQSHQMGGCLQCFQRHGVKFETGMHFIGSTSEGQALRKLMKALEIDDKIQLAPLNPNAYDVVSLGGKQYGFANGREAFIEKMASYFPGQRTNLERYWDLVENVANSSSLHTLRFDQAQNVLEMEYQMRPMDQVIDSVITDPTLAKVLAGTLPLYAAEKGKTPFSTHAFIMDFYNNSAARVVNGSDTIAKALKQVLEKYGGRVICDKKAKRIVCDDTKALGVECEDGSYFEADYVVSGVHPLRTLEMLEDVPLIRPAYRKRLLATKQTVGGFAVYLHFKENTVPYMNYNYYAYSQDTPWGCEDYTPAEWPKGYLYMHFCHQPSPRFAQAGVVLSYMQMKDVEKWKGTKVGHRGANYEDFKERHAWKLLSILERDFPTIKGNIAHYYTSTPLTYLDYTGTEGGSMYGIAKDVNAGLGGRVSHRTRIPNLFLTGQNVNSHGMLGTLVGTIVSCSEILTMGYIYKCIEEANK